MQAGRPGSAIESAARDLAVTASLALQFGCEPQKIRHSLTRLSDNTPAGPLSVLLEKLVEFEAEANEVTL